VEQYKNHLIDELESADLEALRNESSPPVKSHLKWFNGPRGFGFVVPEEDPVDAFLHVTTLQRAGIKMLGDGAILKCRIRRGQKGALVTDITEVIDQGIMPESLTATRQEAPTPKSKTHTMTGAIKWYRADKGFGFVIADDGQKDIFLHKNCLEKHNLTDIEVGRRISMTVKSVPKGREVVEFEFLE
jgi:CspA family cold shock protein